MDDLTARQKQLDGYSIEFSQDESFIYVYFMPKMPRGWRTSTGSLRFWSGRGWNRF